MLLGWGEKDYQGVSAGSGGADFAKVLEMLVVLLLLLVVMRGRVVSQHLGVLGVAGVAVGGVGSFGVVYGFVLILVVEEVVVVVLLLRHGGYWLVGWLVIVK